MFSRREGQSLLASSWPGLVAALIIIVPVLRYGPWVPFVDIVAFVGIDSYPPKMSYGPDHYYTFQYTYVLAHAISRILVDFKVNAPLQVAIFYLAQALVFLGVIRLLLELLVPRSLLRTTFLILGALAFWDGVFLWGGPLPFSLAAALLAVATYLSVRNAAQPSRSANWPIALLTFLAVASHPFAIPFALLLFAVRILFLPRARIQSIGMIVFLLAYRVIIVRENPEADPGDLISQLFYWYPHHLPTRIAHLFTEDFQDVQILFGFQPAALGLYLKFLGLVHLLGFICSPIAAVIAKDKPALRMLATLNTVVGALYFLSEENPVVTMWPQRILSFHSCITYAAGVAVPLYLARRYLPARPSPANLPLLGKVIKAALVLLLAAGMLAVEEPVLKLGRSIGKNYRHLQGMLLASGVNNAVLLTSDLQISPWYLRCVPFLLFSDAEVIQRRLFFVTEWHLQGRHPSRIAAVWNQEIPHYKADLDMEGGQVSIHLNVIPPPSK